MEMPIERFLADAGRGRDCVHTHRFDPLGIEQALPPARIRFRIAAPPSPSSIGNLPVPRKRQSTQICRNLSQYQGSAGNDPVSEPLNLPPRRPSWINFFSLCGLQELQRCYFNDVPCRDKHLAQDQIKHQRLGDLSWAFKKQKSNRFLSQ
jgi:hypothetical protein